MPFRTRSRKIAFKNISHFMKIKEILTYEPHCISPDATLVEAAEDMKTLDVGILPVCEDGELIGAVTDRDIAIRGVAGGCNPKTTTIREVMSPIVVYCFEDQDVREAAELMEKNRIRRLPILNRQQDVIGIISLGDLAIRTQDTDLASRILTRVSEPVYVGWKFPAPSCV